MAEQHKDKAQRVVSTASVLAMAVAALAAVLAAPDAAAAATRPAARATPFNLDTGAPLRPGVYGRIDVSRSAPPPVIHPAPVQVQVQRELASAPPPVYLYVPPGQVRKWPRHCQKWDACAVPVYFVRVDDSPSKLGKWKDTARPAPPVSIVQAFAPRAN